MEEQLHEKEIMGLPIDELQASIDFKKKSRRLGFKTLREITGKSWGDLLRMQGFCYLWFNELVKLLEKNQLLHLLENAKDKN